MNEAIGARLRDFKYPTRPIVPPKIETDSYGTSDRIRTYDLRIRSPLLYPTELQMQNMVGRVGFEPTLNGF